MCNYDSVTKFKKHATVSKCQQYYQWQHERIPPLPRDLFCSLIHQLTVTVLSWVHDTRVCAQKSLALTAVYLITEETTEFKVVEDQNLICSLVAWFLTIVILWLQNSLTMGLNINCRAIILSKDFIEKVQNLNETTSDMTPF